MKTVPDLEGALGGGPTALVLDLDPVVGVRLAADLSARRLADVVLVLPRWPHAEAVLPIDQLTGALVEESKRLEASAAAPHVVFVLDGDRTRAIRRSAADPRVDNRYDLAAGDLPNLAELRTAGIQCVVKVSQLQ
jgi:hypothetical protein